MTTPAVIRKDSVDLVLVPLGLLLMFGYHLYLLYRILRHPETTVIGYENHNKVAWVARMVKGTSDEISLALLVFSTSISAATTMASLSIGLSSLIGAWVTSNSQFFTATVIYGDTSLPTTSVKYVSLLICFLVAFTSFIQSARHYVHANFLMSTLDSDVPVAYVQTAVLRGGNFWSVGLRALYFATTLLLWFFGPIPMLLSCVGIVVVLHLLDTNTIKLHPFKFRGPIVPEGYKAIPSTTNFKDHTERGVQTTFGAFHSLDIEQTEQNARETPSLN